MPDCTLCIRQSVFAACVCVCDYCVMYIHSIHSSGSLTLSVPNEPKWIFCLIRTYWVWGVQYSHCYRRQVLLKILTHCVTLNSNKTQNVSTHWKIGFISPFFFFSFLKEPNQEGENHLASQVAGKTKTQTLRKTLGQLSYLQFLTQVSITWKMQLELIQFYLTHRYPLPNLDTYNNKSN